MQRAMTQLMAWTAAHHTVVTDLTLRTLGVTIEQRRRLVALGVLERVLDGSYRFCGSPADELARCVAACARPIGLIVSGPTAGRLWGLHRMPNDGVVHVIAPPASNPSTAGWLRPYGTAWIADHEIVHRPDGIALTTPPRTAVDLMRHIRPVDVRSVIDQLLREQRCTERTLRITAERLVSPGRAWARRFLELLDTRIPGGPAESHLEIVVERGLVDRGVTGLVRQHWIDVDGWGRVRFDLAVPGLRWAVEVDGHPDHFSATGIVHDSERDLACGAIGWQVNHVVVETLQSSPEVVLDQLAAAWRERRSLLAGVTGSDEV